MKFIRIIKSSLSELENASNWRSAPSLNRKLRRRQFGKDFITRFVLNGEYKVQPLLQLPGGFGENREWHDNQLGNWDKNITEKYIQLAKEKGIVEPIWISVDEDDVKIMEGNHRIKLAKYLNIEYIPVQVTFDSDSLPQENYFDIYTYIGDML